jgi:hypothetical protein
LRSRRMVVCRLSVSSTRAVSAPLQSMTLVPNSRGCVDLQGLEQCRWTLVESVNVASDENLSHGRFCAERALERAVTKATQQPSSWGRESQSLQFPSERAGSIHETA